MRYVLELDYDPQGGVRGTVTWSGREDSVAFCGWLGLLRLLERRAADPGQPPASTR
jgi:hypothetical protein